MKQVLQQVRTGELRVADVPEPLCRSGGIVVRNRASLISAGTEKMLLDFAGKSLVGKARERPDLVRQVLDKVRKDGLGPTLQAVTSRLDQPMALGYSCAGVVTEVGAATADFSVGDRVACAGMGYASHADLVYVPKNLAVRVPDSVDLEDASYVTVGSIALHGVRVAGVDLGARVAVVGLGLLGQLVVQILRAAGCQVLGVDLDPDKVRRARELGAHEAVARSDDVEAAVASFTDGVGADAVIIAAAADTNDPMELACAIARDRAALTVVGAVRMDVPRRPFYDKELELRISRSYGPGRYDPAYEERGQDYPIGYVRWTERRNMEEFLRLVESGAVTPAALTTHRFPIERAADAYEIVTGVRKEAFSGILLTYESDAPSTAAPAGRSVRVGAPRPAGEGLGIGMIGAGNFARSVLLPALGKVDGVRLVGVATTTGASALASAERFNASFATTDVDEVLEHPEVDAVAIATRHDTHASLAARALRAGKAVFLEKPLAVDEEGLEEVLEAQRASGSLLCVGFNRRFSPLAAEMRAALPPGAPRAIAYRVNAGPVPPGSWVHDPLEGGGRVVGEICHFVDLCQFLTGEDPVEAYVAVADVEDVAARDTLSATLRFSGGSLATIFYAANGDRSLPKERIEAFAGGTAAILHDFRTLEVHRGGRRRKSGSSMRQRKGFPEELTAFVRAARGEAPPPISVESLERTTRATFDMVRSLREGRPVAIR